MPITIGPFTNVPAPGDPIRSDWAQQLTQYAVTGFTPRTLTGTSAGQSVNGATLADIQFGTTPPTGWGGPIIFTFPQNGFYVLTFETTGPVVPAAAAHDLIIRVRSTDFPAYVAPGKTKGSVSCVVFANAADSFKFSIYNAAATAVFGPSTITVARIPGT